MVCFRFAVEAKHPMISMDIDISTIYMYFYIHDDFDLAWPIKCYRQDRG